MAFLRVWGIQLIRDQDHAGSSYLTLLVPNLDDQLAALRAASIPVGPTQGTPGLAKVATVADAEGNRITFAEDLTDKS
jgi:hypothetical protein